MSGALTILVAKGQQDAVLTDNPQISFFRQNYKRHVNFSQAVLSQVIQGNPKEAAISTVTFDNKGDMLSYVYLTKKDASGDVQPDFDSGDIEKVEFIIGEQVIDTLTTKQLSAMTCFSSKYPRSTPADALIGLDGFENEYHYPLGFWFCENWQSALPLVALQYHDVQLRITWGSSSSNYVYQVWANYIYLDQDERNYVTEKSTSDILMYQHQSTPASNSLMTILPFNNPVSFLFSGLGDADIMGEGDPSTYNQGKINLKINGVDIVEQKELYPHYAIIPLAYHTSYGKFDNTTNGWKKTPSFIYPFALNCSQLQPSGTCNFSRIDSAYLSSTKNVIKPIYARSYNVLRIQKGMGGLLFSS
jgi:hypothetical protein